MNHYIVIDIGGTSIKHGILQEDLQFAATGETPTQAQKGGPHILQTVLRQITQYQAQYPVCGVCISTAGMVDTQRGVIVYAAPLIPNYTGIAWKETIERETGLPCEVENDVNCAGLAEYHNGAAKGAHIALCITVGTGIGGCVLIDGTVLHGSGYSAGEVGHMQLDGTEFQKLAAASILVSQVAKKKDCSTTALDGKRIFAMAKQGDADCIAAIDQMTEALGCGLANLCYCLNPDTIVLGGGIMAEQDYLRPRIRKSLDDHLIPYVASHTSLAFAHNQNKAGMLGAYFHFMQKQKGGVSNAL